MTIREFAILSGMDYQECVNAVAASEYYVRGRLIDYEPEQLRKALIEYLRGKERGCEHRLAEIRRKLVRIYGTGAT